MSGSHGNRGLRARPWFARLAVIGVLVWAPLAAVGADGPPAGVSGEEWANIQKQLEVERHRIVESDRPGRLWRADNTAQRFTAHFGSEDVVLVPRGRGEKAWELSLRLTAWGATNDLQPVHPATAYSEGNRVEYRRGPLTEWYVNTTMGLEQGFTIEVPPTDDIKDLVLEMTLDGELTAALAASGNGVTFRHGAANTTLTYSGLTAWDAVGEALEARMELAAGGARLRLVVSVDGAAWPITVDPIFTQVAKLLPTPDLDSAYVNFGQAVAVDGDLMVVGLLDTEHGERSGAVHIFRRDPGGAGTWTHIGKIDALDGAPHDEFGSSVAISGDTVVVGAHQDDDNGENSGSAYVYRRDQGGPDAWGQASKITASDGSPDDRFGRAVAIGGDTAVVGAPYDGDNGIYSGSAYVFQRDQGGPDAWGQVAKITAMDGAAGHYFGRAVAITGNTAVLGDPGHDLPFESSGSAYVFRRDHDGPEAWGQVVKITATDAGFHDEFGFSVSISGNTAISGAPESDSLGDESGAAYVFTISDAFFADGFETGDTSGWSVTVP